MRWRKGDGEVNREETGGKMEEKKGRRWRSSNKRRQYEVEEMEMVKKRGDGTKGKIGGGGEGRGAAREVKRQYEEEREEDE